MQHALPEPFRFKAIERIHLPSAEEREQALKEANFNMFALKARDVYIALLTASASPYPFARFAAIALERVQPVPWVLGLSIRRPSNQQNTPSAYRRSSAFSLSSSR